MVPEIVGNDWASGPVSDDRYRGRMPAPTGEIECNWVSVRHLYRNQDGSYFFSKKGLSKDALGESGNPEKVGYYKFRGENNLPEAERIIKGSSGLLKVLVRGKLGDLLRESARQDSSKRL
jgi:hypothetical protein